MHFGSSERGPRQIERRRGGWANRGETYLVAFGTLTWLGAELLPFWKGFEWAEGFC